MIRTAIKFGVFVSVCLAFTLWLAFTIGNIDFEKRYELTATFDDVTGLLIDDNVKVAGVVVGKVTSVKVEEGRATVKFNVKSSLDLPRDTSAAVRWRNLIGQRYLYLYPGEDTDAVLADGDVIGETKSVVDLGELFDELGPIVSAIDPQQVNAFLDSVTKALEGREDVVSGAIDDLAVLAKGLGQRDQAIGRLVENLDTVAGTIAQRDQQIRTMLDNLVAISRTFSANTDVLDEAITELGSLSASLGFLLEDNDAEIDRLLSNAADITDVVASKLDVVDRALAGLDDAARAIYLAGASGEFLNQVILCAAVDAPANNQCDIPVINQVPINLGASAGGPLGSAATRGSTALEELLGRVLR